MLNLIKAATASRPDRTMPCRVCGKPVAHRYIGPQPVPNRTLHLYNSRCCEATRVPEEQ